MKPWKTIDVYIPEREKVVYCDMRCIMIGNAQ